MNHLQKLYKKLNVSAQQSDRKEPVLLFCYINMTFKTEGENTEFNNCSLDMAKKKGSPKKSPAGKKASPAAAATAKVAKASPKTATPSTSKGTWLSKILLASFP